MFKVRGILKFLREGNDRFVPIKDSYRPLFMIDEHFFSGGVMIEGNEIKKGEEEVVTVFFIKQHNIAVGDVISFYEPPKKIGEFLVKEIME